MSKIKVLYQLNDLGFGGTIKTIQAFIENLDPQKFEPYLFVYSNKGTFRYYRHFAAQFFSEKHKKRFQDLYIKNYTRKADFEKSLGTDRLFFGRWNQMKKVIDTIKPDIIHFSRGVEKDFYTEGIVSIDPKIKVIETNVFARQSSDAYFKRLSKMYFMSKYCLDKSPWVGDKGGVLYLGTQKPKSKNNLRQKYNIPLDAIVLGQIGRPDLVQDDFVYNVYQKYKNDNVYLIVVGCCHKVKELKKPSDKIIPIEATSSRDEIDAFYNTIDILLHRRLDGETFGLNIAEAMIYGKPVVSHFSDVDNAQAELLNEKEFGPVGFISGLHDLDTYTKNLDKLIKNQALRQEMGQNAHKKALAHYEEKAVTSGLEKDYLELV